MIFCGGEISIDWDSDDASSWKTISSAPVSTVDFYLKKWLIWTVDRTKRDKVSVINKTYLLDSNVKLAKRIRKKNLYFV